MTDGLAEVEAIIDSGFEAIKQGDREHAIDEFDSAVDKLDDVSDRRKRRDKYAQLAQMFIQLQAAERGLDAARVAVELDEELGDRNLLGQDVLLCGTAIGRMGNVQAAVNAYSDALKIFLEDENWANAASANTNIAVIVGQNDIDQGIEMLEQSLVYLGRQPFPHTEIITRIALIQALVVAERSPERVFQVAGELFAKFWHELRPDQRENSVGPLEMAIKRYLLQHPVADVAAWKAERFPQVYG